MDKGSGDGGSLIGAVFTWDASMLKSQSIALLLQFSSFRGKQKLRKNREQIIKQTVAQPGLCFGGIKPNKTSHEEDCFSILGEKESFSGGWLHWLGLDSELIDAVFTCVHSHLELSYSREADHNLFPILCICSTKLFLSSCFAKCRKMFSHSEALIIPQGWSKQTSESQESVVIKTRTQEPSATFLKHNIKGQLISMKRGKIKDLALFEIPCWGSIEEAAM